MTQATPPPAAKPPAFKAAIVPVTPFDQNCTLIWNEETKVGAVIDPGGNIDRIMMAVAEVGMTLEKILLTHGHIDHAGGAAELREKTGVPVEGPHLADRFMLDHLKEQGETYGFPARNVTPDRWLDEGEQVTVGGHVFDVLHCPGHSPGSVVFQSKAQKFLLVGDVLFRGSIGRTDLPQGDHAALLRSIESKLLVLDDSYAFICGHGPGSTIGLERRTNPFLR